MTASPVVVRYEVEVLVEGTLGLFVDHAENLIDRSPPWISLQSVNVKAKIIYMRHTAGIHEGGIFCGIVVRSREFEETAQ